MMTPSHPSLFTDFKSLLFSKITRILSLSHRYKPPQMLQDLELMLACLEKGDWSRIFPRELKDLALSTRCSYCLIIFLELRTAGFFDII